MKKKLTRALKLPFLAGLLLLPFVACNKTFREPTDPVLATATAQVLASGSYLSNLLAYKASPHHPFVGFLVHDGADPDSATNPANAPDSIDFLEFFAGYDTTQADWRVAQAKGTRIVQCHFVADAYFDGSVNDPATQVPGYVNPPGFNQTTPTSTSTYHHFASNTYTDHITNRHLDGIDIDIESGTFGSECTQSNGPALLTALAAYFGPSCTLCTVPTGGKKPLFFYDTDGSASDNTMYTPYKSNYDYVLFQSYTTGNHYWSGRGTQDFPPLVQMYGLDKLIFLVNGDNFGDAVVPDELYSYAHWVVNNNGVGVGAYRMSRDWNYTPHFISSRTAIQIMNPANTGSGIVSGATYQLVSAVNNSSVMDVYGWGTANGTKVEIWSKNSPVSTNQEWVATAVAGGYYTLQPVCTPGSLLDAYGWGTANGTIVSEWVANGGTNQQWLITPAAGGYYTLSPSYDTALKVDVSSSATANGTQVQLYGTNGTNAQLWQFVKQ